MEIRKSLALLVTGILCINGILAQQKLAAPAPPLGWNSYDCFGSTVTESEVRANAEMMAVHLKQYGWKKDGCQWASASLLAQDSQRNRRKWIHPSGRLFPQSGFEIRHGS